MARRPRSAWPIEKMIEWYQSGQTAVQIAAILGSEEWQEHWIQTGRGRWKPHHVSVATALKETGISLRQKGKLLVDKRQKPWPFDRMIEWYNNGHTLQEIADLLASDEWQPYWIGKTQKEYRPNQKIVNKVMKKRFPLRNSGACGSRNGSWKGGRRTDKSGYILVYAPDHPMASSHGTVREHRLVAEKALGRYLTETEVVHHRDDDPTNNHPDNLMVYETNAQHISETTKGKHSERSRVGIARRFAMTNSLRVLAFHDAFLTLLHCERKLSIYQMAELLDIGKSTIGRHLNRLGLTDRRVKTGIVTDSIREECRQFLASLNELILDVQSSPETTVRQTG